MIDRLMILIGIYIMVVLQYIGSLTIFQLLSHLIACYYIGQLIRLALFTLWNVLKECLPINDILNKYSQPTTSNPECWAVVTGATDGIGLGFAQTLTQLGFDVCLISRNQQKLNQTLQNLKQFRHEKFNKRKFMTIQFDFENSSSQTLFEQMVQKVKKLDVGILVNNVGTSEIKQFEDLSYEQIKKIINVNCSSMSLMTAALLKQMKNRKSKSAIINLSSFAGQNPVPFVCLYSATKAMNTFFSEGLSMQNPQMDILSVRPMFVQSPLSRKKKGLNIPDRRQCAWACLKELRWEYQTNGYITHRILAKLHQLFVPNFLNRKMSKILAIKEMIEYNSATGSNPEKK